MAQWFFKGKLEQCWYILPQYDQMLFKSNKT